MLYLYWFGRILTDFLHKRYIVPLYLTGGIIGAFSFMLIFNISPSFQTHAYILRFRLSAGHCSCRSHAGA